MPTLVVVFVGWHAHYHSTPPSLSDISGSVKVHNPKALAGCPADFGKQPTEIVPGARPLQEDGDDVLVKPTVIAKAGKYTDNKLKTLK